MAAYLSLSFTKQCNRTKYLFLILLLGATGCTSTIEKQATFISLPFPKYDFHSISVHDQALLIGGGQDWTAGVITDRTGQPLFSADKAIFKVLFAPALQEHVATGVSAKLHLIDSAIDIDLPHTLIGRDIATHIDTLMVAGGKSYAVGAVTILVGKKYIRTDTFDFELRTIDFHAGNWVAAGYGNIISYKGKKWQKLPYDGDFYIQSSVFEEELYILGQHNHILHTSDNIAFQEIKLPKTDRRYTAITVTAAAIFVANEEGSILVYRFDNKKWIRYKVADSSINDVTVKEDSLFFCGDLGLFGYVQLPF